MANREIWQEIKIKASPDKVYQALTDVKKLAHWWTTDTRGECAIGKHLEFWFGGRGPSATMEVTALKESELVRWKATERTTPDWVGTELEFKIFGEDGRSVVHLRHSKWREDAKMFPECSLVWAIYLLSLKEFVETGKGHPYPYNVYP
jgi:uncharacterized protein YndB with AHSA1/START domain